MDWSVFETKTVIRDLGMLVCDNCVTFDMFSDNK